LSAILQLTTFDNTFGIFKQQPAATNGAGAVYLSGAPEFTPVFSGVYVAHYFVL
jgi:hypothetical protein